jgi:dTDP-glucose 4,6-dehydratase
MTILVSGGAGFIDGNFVLDWIAGSDEPVVNLYKLSCAGNIESLYSLHGNIAPPALLDKLQTNYRHRALINSAFEIYVDRAIQYAEELIHINIVRPYHLFEALRVCLAWLSEGVEDRYALLAMTHKEVIACASKRSLSRLTGSGPANNTKGAQHES